MKAISRCSRSSCAVLMAALFSVPWMAGAFGEEGHRTVGAIADILLADTKAGGQVKAILGGETLEESANWADEVRDGNSQAAKDFRKRNPFQRGYHFTNLPIQFEAYTANAIGTSPHDVVQTINRCVKILRDGHDGTDMTRTEALKMLVHLVGDIHQPLHVGSAYLDSTNKLLIPSDSEQAAALSTQGGNWIRFGGTKLHSYWDTKTVQKVMAKAGVETAGELAVVLTQKAPQGWKSNAKVGLWSRNWAKEMLPIARSAYDLSYGKPYLDDDHLVRYAKTADFKGYEDWSAETIKTNMTRAGYRLAALLRDIWPD